MRDQRLPSRISCTTLVIERKTLFVNKILNVAPGLGVIAQKTFPDEYLGCL